MKKLFVISAFVLSACGGGDGNVSTTPVGPSTSTSAFALDTAATNIFSSPQTFNLTARTGDGRNFSLAFISTPQPDASFERRLSKLTQVTTTIRENGTVETNTSRRFFSADPLLLRGTTTTGDPDGQNHLVFSATSPLPASANVGSNGPVATGQFFTNSNKTTATGTEVVTYSVEADTANTAFLCFNSTVRNSVNTILVTGSECYKITTNGSVLGLKVSNRFFENGVMAESVEFK